MVQIPQTLKKSRFRFIKVKSNKKRPFEKGWQKDTNYRYDDPELQKHLEKGGNYGVLGGYGDLVLIDADIEEVEELIEDNLPETLKVRSGSGGSHFYYKCKDIQKPIRLTSGDAQGDVGDIQYRGKQVVGPGSIHPNGNRYKIENNGGISKISVVELRSALQKYIKSDVEETKEEEERLRKKHDSDIDLSISQVVSTAGLKKRGQEYQGPHPVHGSNTGKNFSMNLRKGTWHCFRHDTGGGPMSWIAVEHGIISCEEAVPGALRGEKFKDTLKIAEDEYGLEVEEREKEKLDSKTKKDIEDKILSLNKKEWNCRSEFITFTDKIEFKSGEVVDFPQTYELPKKLAEELIDKKITSKGIWRCEKCGTNHYRKRKPYSCRGDECDSSKFIPIHPESSDEMGDALIENYRFAVPMESMTEREAGKIHIYEGGVYKTKGVIGFIRNKVKKMNHLSKQRDQSHVINHIATLNSYPLDRFGIEGPRVVLEEGILNLEEEKMEEHDPDVLALSKIGIEYKPDESCPKFLEYLEEVIPEEKDRKRLQEFLGSALVNEKIHKKAIILVGPTDAGKSTFVKIIGSIIGGDNISHQGPSSLSNTRWGKANLRGKMLNTSDEVRANKLKNLAILKKIFDGNEIEAERKGEKTFEYSPTCEHIFCANQTPTAERKDDAFWNRWIPIEIPNKIPGEKIDPDLAEKILEERKGIFNWIVEGYQEFIDNNKRFSFSLDWKDARDKWLSWGDSIQRFIHFGLEEDEGNKISAKELHEIYSNFAQKHNLDAEGQRKLTREVKKVSYALHSKNYVIDGKRKTGFKNLKVSLNNNTNNTNNSLSLRGLKKSKSNKEDSTIEEYGKESVNGVIEEKTLNKAIRDCLKGIGEGKLIDDIVDEIEGATFEDVEKTLKSMKRDGMIRVEKEMGAKYYILVS